MDFKTVETGQDLEKLEKWLSSLGRFAFDCETTGLDWTKHKIFLLSFSDGVHSVVVPVNRFAHGHVKEFLMEIFKDPNDHVIGQNLKFDAHHAMSSYGVEICCEWQDTQMMAFLMDENRSNSLKKLMKPLLGLEPGDEEKIKSWMTENQGKQENWDYSKVPEPLMLPYSAMDPFATYKLYEKLLPGINAYFKELYETQRQVIKIMWRMEQNGLPVDRQQLQRFIEDYAISAEKAKLVLFQEAGFKFNPASPNELKELLYDKLKMPVLFRTKTREPSTDETALLAMNHPVTNRLLDYRQYLVPLNYAQNVLSRLDPNDLVHSDYSMTWARTGRWSCSEPNLQNTPKNKELRRCFITAPDEDMLFFDHAQIEMVGFAHYSKDPKMVAALQQGQDLHALAASEVYGIPLDQVTKEQRAVGKGTNFSIIYGVGKAKLASYINGYMPEGKRLNDAEAQAFKLKYFSRFPTVQRFQYQVQDTVKTKRQPWGYYVKNQFGRVRRIEHPYDWVDEKGQKQRGTAYTAVNHLIQGWAPDVMRQGMVKIDKLLKPRWRQNVHDELRIDQPRSQTPAQRREVVQEIIKCLTDFPQVRVPINCKVEWSQKSWAELEPYKE